MWAVLMWWTRTLSSTFAGNSFLHWSHLIVRAAACLNPDLIACDFGLLVIHLLILAPRAPLPVAPPLGLPLPRPDPPPTRTEPELTSTVTASRPWFCFNYAFDSFQTFVMSASLSFSFWSSPRLTRRQRSFTWRGQKGNYFLSEKQKGEKKEKGALRIPSPRQALCLWRCLQSIQVAPLSATQAPEEDGSFCLVRILEETRTCCDISDSGKPKFCLRGARAEAWWV